VRAVRHCAESDGSYVKTTQSLIAAWTAVRTQTGQALAPAVLSADPRRLLARIRRRWCAALPNLMHHWYSPMAGCKSKGRSRSAQLWLCAAVKRWLYAWLRI
jgi:hypothetical protein